MRFRRPRRPGDALSGTDAIDDVRLDDRGRGLVPATVRLVDGAGDRVLDRGVESNVRRRG
ncbi:MaoC domain-containing protein dehydratase [Rhodococcus ruber]|nr:MaoC domain-containing protein dehydratase [Rhodococcus ruber]